ncbi:MAG: FadR/GntR family transcriptional regulator [Hyphomonadaceae bacterium]
MTKVSRPREAKRPRRVFEQICDDIRKQLADGSLSIGDRLPSERELAARLGYSRWAIREARRALEADGVLKLEKNGAGGGAFVSDLSGSSVTRSLRDVMVLGRISMTDLTNVRTLLLVSATELACENATEADLLALEADIEQTVEALKKYKGYLQIDTGNFGKLIGRSSKSPLLSMLVDTVTDLMTQGFRNLNVEFPPELNNMRQAILDSLIKHDKESAVRAITSYLDYVHRDVVSRVAARGRRRVKPVGAK